MRLTQKQAAQNRRSIIDTASRLFRQRGFDGVGLADLMKAAGFTHGGFYNHFPSKEALATAVCSAALSESNAGLTDALGHDSDESRSGLQHYVEVYLSQKHRDDLGGGCPLAGLAADVARGGKPVKTAFADGIEKVLATCASHLSKADFDKTRSERASTPRERAMLLLSETVGALLLARAVAGANPSLSEEILQASRQKFRVSKRSEKLARRRREKRGLRH